MVRVQFLPGMDREFNTVQEAKAFVETCEDQDFYEIEDMSNNTGWTLAGPRFNSPDGLPEWVSYPLYIITPGT